ncbi:hypothetical protein KP13_06880 (plasmid) [Klebsiella pneumoniae subsp. pneumoniae Kp13]|uniref:Uncharacterized protein n=1 Tax=Klebsiella pneumoniae TaxID=573 RepID=A0A411KVV7_KLEPN|nr:hypothetical protein KP13_06880 [Klebsiella pneumoniae subsp. pneumoniae Kp13]QBC88525.1 hypothetical protein pKPB11_016 [Klebsiella pneumoniae]QBC88559.1 hypothetical protein pKP89_025 [Klebsiella pneumoniae]
MPCTQEKQRMASREKLDAHPFQQSVLLITCVPTFYIPREGIECHGIRLPPQPDTTPN